jgi:hypothetical protein
VLFIIAIIGLEKQSQWPPNVNFTVDDLLGNDTNGFINSSVRMSSPSRHSQSHQIVQILTCLVDRLPLAAFSEDPQSPLPRSDASQSSLPSDRDILREPPIGIRHGIAPKSRRPRTPSNLSSLGFSNFSTFSGNSSSQWSRSPSNHEMNRLGVTFSRIMFLAHFLKGYTDDSPAICVSLLPVISRGDRVRRRFCSL